MTKRLLSSPLTFLLSSVLLLLASPCPEAVSIDDGFGAVEGVSTLAAALRNTQALKVREEY
jgi:hypothetical protein